MEAKTEDTEVGPAELSRMQKGVPPGYARVSGTILVEFGESPGRSAAILYGRICNQKGKVPSVINRQRKGLIPCTSTPNARYASRMD